MLAPCAVAKPVQEETQSLRRAEVLSDLRVNLGDVIGCHDAALLALKRLRRAVEIHLHRLRPLTRPGQEARGCPSVQKLGDLINSMAKEVQEAIAQGCVELARAEGGIPSGGLSAADEGWRSMTYEALRQGLQNLLQRNEVLNAEMAQQTQANAELVESLSSTKDTNKRLLEQVRFHTDEIAQLTQQRVDDEERLEILKRKHRADRSAFDHALQQRLTLLKEHAGSRSNGELRQAKSKLRHIAGLLELVNRGVAALVREQGRLRHQAAAVSDMFLKAWQAASSQVFSSCQHLSTTSSERCTALRKAIGGWAHQLSEEKALRKEEVLVRSHVLSSVSSDSEDVQARRTRDLSLLNSRLQALERSLLTDRKAWAAERQQLDSRLLDLQGRRHSAEDEVARLQKDEAQLAAVLSADDQQLEQHELVVADLQQKAFERNDTLSSAVSGNDHLRGQLEEYQGTIEERNQAEVSLAKEEYERLTEERLRSREEELRAAQERLKALLERLQSDGEALKQLERQAQGVAADCESLQADGRSWCSRHDALQEQRKLQEDELTAVRQKAALDRVQLQASSDCLVEESSQSHQAIQRLEAELDSSRRSSTTREVHRAAWLGSEENQLRESRALHSELEHRLQEAVGTRRQLLEAWSTGRRQAEDLQAHLQGQLESLRSSARETRSVLEAELHHNKELLEEVRCEYERELARGPDLLEQAEEDSLAKLDQLEDSRARVEASCQADLGSANEAVAHLEHRCKILEKDLSRIRYMHAESQQTNSWVLNELAKEDEMVPKRDVRLLEALQEALDQEASVSARLQELHQEEDQLRLAKEFESRKQLEELLPARQPESEEALLEQENRQFRNVLERRSSNGLSMLQSRLEANILRLQRHTEDVRSRLKPTRDVLLREPISLAARPS